MSERREGFGKAYEIETEEGTAVFFLEGLRGQAEANSVCAELATAFERQVGQKGLRHIACAIPPSLRMTLVRGNRIELEPKVDGRIRIVVHGRDDDSPIIRVGQ